MTFEDEYIHTLIQGVAHSRNTNSHLHYCWNLKSCCTSYLYIVFIFIVSLSCILIVRYYHIFNFSAFVCRLTSLLVTNKVSVFICLVFSFFVQSIIIINTDDKLHLHLYLLYSWVCKPVLCTEQVGSRGNTSDQYVGDSQFESRPKLRFIEVFLSPTWKISR